MKNFPFSTKIFTILFVVSICFSSAGAPRAHACLTFYYLGTGYDLCAPLTYIETKATALFSGTTAGATTANAGTSAALTWWETVGKPMLDAAAYQAAQGLLEQLSQNTIKWIQGGFHGSPSFAVDVQQIATGIADNIAGGMVLSLRNIAVCNFSLTYTDDLSNAVALSAAKRPYIFNQQAACPFKQNYGFTATQFYNAGNKFAWGAFGDALNNGGNPYGLQLLATTEQQRREDDAKAQKDKELAWSNGFTSIKDITKCNYPPELTSVPNDPADPHTGTFDDTLPIMTQAQADANNAAVWNDPAVVANLQDHYCETTTPGKIVGDQLTKTLGLDMDRLGFADNMNKIVSALIKEVTQETVRSVFGKTQKLSTHNSGSLAATLAGNTGATSPVTGTTPLIAVNALPATNITSDSVILNGTISYAAPGATAGFILSSPSDLTDTSVLQSPVYPDSGTFAGRLDPGGQPVVVIISPSPTVQTFRTTITGLIPDTTYWFTANAKANYYSSLQTQADLHSASQSFHTPAQ